MADEDGSILHQTVNSVLDDVAAKILAPEAISDTPKKTVEKYKLPVKQMPRKYSGLTEDGAELIAATFTHVAIYLHRNPQIKDAGVELISEGLPFSQDTITKIDHIFRQISQIRKDRIARSWRKALMDCLGQYHPMSTRSFWRKKWSSTTTSFFDLFPWSTEFYAQIHDSIFDTFSQKVLNLIDNQQVDSLDNLSKQIAKYYDNSPSKAVGTKESRVGKNAKRGMGGIALV
ncbi:hypothetical protein Pst134EB_010381 [Puccinia striiformis f. sp. tritici]|nr:hypothetical protein Pst134EB_010381 [Puccinia striiformis f. sp. tritici]